ncbi:MAG: uroporphyrinogen-III synthase [Chloroflexi bacterium]|nr:uroporphyrinogen-III synthase [Chloroflexota bacterium]
MASLYGKTIAILEARRSQELASLIERHGGVPYVAPTLREALLENEAEVAGFIDRVIQGPVDLAIFLTGVGTQRLLDRAEALGRKEALLAALARPLVAARGPKPVAVLKRHNVRIDLVPPEPNTSDDLLALLRAYDWHGKTVALQHYGRPNEALRDALQALGAQVLEVSLYRWDLPADQGPVVAFVEALLAGQIAVVALTSASQVHNLVAIAEGAGLGDDLLRALRAGPLLASVGPVCSRALEAYDLPVHVTPEHPKMGHLVLAVAAALEARYSAPAGLAAP